MLILSTRKHRLQLSSKLSINHQINEKIREIINEQSEPKIPADFSSEVESVETRDVGYDEDQQQADADLHRLHVTSWGVGVCAVTVQYKRKTLFI